MIGHLRDANVWASHLEVLRNNTADVVAAESGVSTTRGLDAWRAKLDNALTIITQFGSVFGKSAVSADQVILEGVLTDETRALGQSVDRVARALRVSI